MADEEKDEGKKSLMDVIYLEPQVYWALSAEAKEKVNAEIEQMRQNILLAFQRMQTQQEQLVAAVEGFTKAIAEIVKAEDAIQE